MYSLRRWWDRNWIQVALVGLVISVAWVVRQTNGGTIFEVYQLVSRPFQPTATNQEILKSAKVVELEAKLQELEKQNQKLRDLVGYASKSKQEGIVTPIIGRSADHWWQHVTLGRGSKDGIKEGFVVTAPGGLVGLVSKVTDHTSRVLLISDPSSRVGAIVSRSRYMGIMRGQSGNKAVMQFFERVPDVRRGDVVATSSASERFPTGIPIGKIESVDLSKSPAPEAVISLLAPTSNLEWVVVYPAEASSNSDGSRAKP